VHDRLLGDPVSPPCRRDDQPTHERQEKHNGNHSGGVDRRSRFPDADDESGLIEGT
jgi:hypothetical protein